MAQVRDGWLPFDDEVFGRCHLDYCQEEKKGKSNPVKPKIIRRKKKTATS
jgi:hypothetical protein